MLSIKIYTFAAMVALIGFSLPALDGYNYCGEGVKLCKGEKKHIMCHPEQIEIEGKYQAHVPMTRSIKRRILDLHNEYRNGVAGGIAECAGGKFLPAARMRLLLWDDELAYMAHVHAERCHLKHDECRSTTRFPNAGQNLGVTKLDEPFKVQEVIHQLVTGWYDEKKVFMDPASVQKYDSGVHAGAGHLTVMIQDRVAHVGCAMTLGVDCGAKFCVYLTCNYDFTNLIGTPIYTSADKSGTSCSDWGTELSSEWPHLCENSGENYNADDG